MAEKRYYWFKLKDDFFDGVKIKKLRQLAGGDTYTIIYLKMLLKAMKTDGVLEYQGVEDNICDEIALDINEAPENVRVALSYLLSKGLAEQIENDCFLPESIENVGSENSSAQRVREYRNRQKTLHCNTDVTQVKRIGNVEIEKDIDIEKEKRKRRIFTPHTLAEVQAYCHERNNSINAETFIDYYESNGWLVGKNKMKDWKATVRRWEQNNYHNSNAPSNKSQQGKSQIDFFMKQAMEGEYD